MFKEIKLSHSQWRRLASAFSNVSQAIIIFSLAAVFVPEAVALPRDFSRLLGLIYLFWGLLMLAGSVILSKKED